MTRTRFLVLLLLSTGAWSAPSAANAQKKITFPDDGCARRPSSGARLEIQCRYIGSPSGIRTYELLHGPSHRKLMTFIRSVEILESRDRTIFAVNSHEGSNYTNCYIFRDPMHPAKTLSLAAKWAPLRATAPRQYRRRIVSADHEYYTCTRWHAGILTVSARWGSPDGSWVVGTTRLLPTGAMEKPSFGIEVGERE